MSATDDKTAGKVWHKVTMSVAKSDADAVRKAIQSKYCCGIQSEDETGDREHLDAYFDNAIDASDLQKHMEIIADLISAAGGRRLKLGEVEAVPEEDWAAEWRKSWKPVRVSKGLVVCPSWEKFPSKQGETVVYIYPKMAFGTGSHPTTRLCLRLLEKHMLQGAGVIDIGSGSGILAIAAARLGARRVTAVEMDENSIENAEENSRINRVRSRVRLIHEPFGPHIRGTFDLGVCNMLLHVITPLLDDITRLLTGKSLIISGISDDSAAEFKRSFKARGWHIRQTLRDGEWLGFFAEHEAK
jgi:ribosomal protein L11 methyltransferase